MGMINIKLAMNPINVNIIIYFLACCITFVHVPTIRTAIKKLIQYISCIDKAYFLL
ncbi:hypothetical protein CH68_1702 [Francisella tularensis subsp. holarctica]|uniref:Uncharacterized protein n=1 Tax=Francisella tularensis subsp. holarctica (strain LVS) TaxID=376619 RepID=A0AAI8FUJ9_FRATH|nr:hypothetical protein DA46_1176 [Francisella tularensis subsp. holarctica]AJI59969.1 hypothetical protein AW21_384 [Francisella tularensis subsp. holarctica LVS]AJI64762.1 hypothetical protein CH67_1972 [Francisella tularensis subsp. holarctica]AJI66687.1 hypothetical protein CH68_1702 [Francisella tularensis subsp. holarctica]